jgi:hypothetical protein
MTASQTDQKSAADDASRKPLSPVAAREMADGILQRAEAGRKAAAETEASCGVDAISTACDRAEQAARSVLIGMDMALSLSQHFKGLGACISSEVLIDQASKMRVPCGECPVIADNARLSDNHTEDLRTFQELYEENAELKDRVASQEATIADLRGRLAMIRGKKVAAVLAQPLPSHAMGPDLSNVDGA